MTDTRLVLFDLDGTLMRCGRASRRAYEEGLAALWPDDNGADLLRGVPFAGRTDLGILAELFAKTGRPFSPEALEKFWPPYLDALERWLVLEPPQVFGGAREAPAALRSRGIAAGLLTGNHYEGAMRKLRAGDCDAQLTWGGFGGDARERADLIPLALAAATAATGESFTAAETLLVGDTPLDIACARAHGARVAVLPTGPHSEADLRSHQPDIYLDSLDQLINHF